MTIARALADHFDDGEMRMLMAEMEYDPENLTATTHDLRAIELVEAMERRDWLPELVRAMRRARPRMRIDA